MVGGPVDRVEVEELLTVQDLRREQMEARARRFAARMKLADLKKEKSLSADLERKRDELEETVRTSEVEEERAARKLNELALSHLAAGKLIPLNHREIQAALEPGEILLAFEITSRASYLFFVGSGRGSSEQSPGAHPLSWADGTT